MLDLITDATAFFFAALLYASCFLWCSCLQVVGGLRDFAIWHAFPFLCLLQDQVENFVIPSEESSSITKMAASGDQISCLNSDSQSTTYCRRDYTVPPDFLSGDKVHWLQRISYEEPAEEKVVYRLPSSIIRDVREDAGSYPSDSEGSTESDGQIANELGDPMDVDEVDPLYEPMGDPMDVDEVDPLYEPMDDPMDIDEVDLPYAPMDIDQQNLNLGWAHGNEQFNFEFVLPRTNFEIPGVALQGAAAVVDEEAVVNNVFHDQNPVQDEAQNVPVNALALDIPRVLLDPPQRAAPAALEDDLGREIEDIFAEILGDSDSD